MRKTIDAERASRMRELGLTCRVIGILLAVEDDRELPYLASSIGDAVRRINEKSHHEH